MTQKNQFWRPGLVLSLALGAATTVVAPAEARTTKIIIDTTTQQTIGGASYQFQVGRIFGELDPADSHNTIIQDIGLAPLNGNGKVPYVGTVAILKPTSGANGVMLYQVSNRGGQSLPNAGNIAPGATYVWSGWQGDLLESKGPCITDYPCEDLNAGPYNGASGTHVLQVPTAHNGDGSTITGPVYGGILNTSGSTAQLNNYTNPVPYRPVTLDTTQATFWSVTHQDIVGGETGKTIIPSSDWAWADCRTTPFPGTPDPTRICLRNGFNPSLMYQMVYTARDPLVLGIGFAATRDAVSFLRDAATDDVGTANPLAGQVTKVVGMGTSQSGNYLRTFTYYGFNQNESNARVFDVIWPHIAGRQLWMNTRFAQPDVIQTIYMAADEAPVWWGDHVDASRPRAPDGILHSCTATNTCPTVVQTYGALEFWALKASPDHIGADATTDIAPPANVFSYYFPGTTHGGGSASAIGSSGAGNAASTVFPTTTPAAPTNCSLPANPNPEADQFNAILDDVVAFVTAGTPLPASSYPKLALGQLVPATQTAMAFPTIPGFPFVPNLVNPFINYDFGPQFNAANQTGIISNAPPTVLGTFPTYVVKTNTDGNEVAGIPSVNMQAPLGTYTGWNTWAVGGRQGEICNLNGSFWPFQTTQAARLAAGDPRPSLEERYGTHNGFVCVVKLAATQAVSKRFLRAAARTALINAANSSSVLNGVTPTAADTARANLYCAAAGGTAP
jgi:Alpha/beta hydrolase domain